MKEDIFEQYRTVKILILEDIPEDAELAIRELEKGGFIVKAKVVDDEGGFTAGIRDFQPEIILADYSLPSITGLEALAIALDMSSDLPFVFVTGTIGEEIAAETILNGASGLVLKSRLSRLPDVVKEIFNKEGRWYNRRLKFASERINNRIKTNIKALDRLQEFIRNNNIPLPHELSSEMSNSIRELTDMSKDMDDQYDDKSKKDK